MLKFIYQLGGQLVEGRRQLFREILSKTEGGSSADVSRHNNYNDHEISRLQHLGDEDKLIVVRTLNASSTSAHAKNLDSILATELRNIQGQPEVSVLHVAEDAETINDNTLQETLNQNKWTKAKDADITATTINEKQLMSALEHLDKAFRNKPVTQKSMRLLRSIQTETHTVKTISKLELTQLITNLGTSTKPSELLNQYRQSWKGCKHSEWLMQRPRKGSSDKENRAKQFIETVTGTNTLAEAAQAVKKSTDITNLTPGWALSLLQALAARIKDDQEISHFRDIVAYLQETIFNPALQQLGE